MSVSVYYLVVDIGNDMECIKRAEAIDAIYILLGHLTCMKCRDIRNLVNKNDLLGNMFLWSCF